MLEIRIGRRTAVKVCDPSHFGDIHNAAEMLWEAGYSIRKFEQETAHLAGKNRAIADKIILELEWRAEDEY